MSNLCGQRLYPLAVPFLGVGTILRSVHTYMPIAAAVLCTPREMAHTCEVWQRPQGFAHPVSTLACHQYTPCASVSAMLGRPGALKTPPDSTRIPATSTSAKSHEPGGARRQGLSANVSTSARYQPVYNRIGSLLTGAQHAAVGLPHARSPVVCMATMMGSALGCQPMPAGRGGRTGPSVGRGLQVAHAKRGGKDKSDGPWALQSEPTGVCMWCQNVSAAVRAQSGSRDRNACCSVKQD